MITPFAAYKLAFKKSWGQSIEAFLAGGVPDLHFEFDAFNFEYLHFEVNGDGCEVVYEEVAFVKTLENACLANAAVAN